ncbi:MAG: hypothetical protein YK1309IOTA_1950003 [Marine Group I thaumarchaeote]|nr:MAG: hypothetical protein YK1309IOTA_1950003 [Marine Group I thaumarchaeote]
MRLKNSILCLEKEWGDVVAKKDEDLKIPKYVLEQFEEEYPKFCSWARSEMSKSEFVEFMILQAKHRRMNHRSLWLFYSITANKIGILDRKNKEKVTVNRIHDYLLCDKDNAFGCMHCIFCLNDKEVKKSLNEKYVWYITRAYKPKITWPKLQGQKLDFKKIIGNKTFFDDIPTGDYGLES